MKKYIGIISIATVVLIFFICYFCYSSNKIKKYESDIEKLDDYINNHIDSKQDDLESSKKYDCSFTKTHRIIEVLDYHFALDGVSYAIVDDFQGYQPYIVIIPKSIEDNLEENKYYEFKYTLNGVGVVRNFDDINSYLIGSLFNKYNGNSSSGTIYIDLEIKESNKSGLDQIQENICQK